MGLTQEFRDYMNSVISFPADYFAGWFGVAPAESGVQVNELTAMQISTFTACVRVIADALATTPLNVYERKEDGGLVMSYTHPLFRMLHLQPNPEVSAADLRQTGQGHILLTGNCFFEIIRNNGGFPVALFARSPFRTFPYRTQDGTLIYKTADTPHGTERTIEAFNMVHVKGLGLDGLVGLSPVKYYAREVLGTALAMQSYGSKFFANDSRPGGYLKTQQNLKPEQKLEVVNSWISGHSRGQAHSVALLEGDMTWEKVGINPDEAQFLESRQMSRSEIAAIFGVPAHLVGDREETRSNMEQRALEFLVWTIKPWLHKWEQEINIKLFPNTGRTAGKYIAKFDTTWLERADFATVLKGVQMGRYAGLYSINEGRHILGLNPVEDKNFDPTKPGDSLWQPVNMLPIAENDEDEPDAQGGGSDSVNENTNPSEKTSPSETESPNEQGRSLETVFYPVFRDGIGRVLARKSPDKADFKRCFGPIVSAIARTSKVSDSFVEDYLGGLQQRSADWKQETADQEALAELKRLLNAVGKS